MQAQLPIGSPLMTGDVINLAIEGEVRTGADLAEGVGPPDRVTAIPGNHDAYVRSTQHRFAEVFCDSSAATTPPMAAAPFHFCVAGTVSALIGPSTAAPIRRRRRPQGSGYELDALELWILCASNCGSPSRPFVRLPGITPLWSDVSPSGLPTLTLPHRSSSMARADLDGHDHIDSNDAGPRYRRPILGNRRACELPRLPARPPTAPPPRCNPLTNRARYNAWWC